MFWEFQRSLLLCVKQFFWSINLIPSLQTPSLWAIFDLWNLYCLVFLTTFWKFFFDSVLAFFVYLHNVSDKITLDLHVSALYFCWLPRFTLLCYPDFFVRSSVLRIRGTLFAPPKQSLKSKWPPQKSAILSKFLWRFKCPSYPRDTFCTSKTKSKIQMTPPKVCLFILISI